MNPGPAADTTLPGSRGGWSGSSPEDDAEPRVVILSCAGSPIVAPLVEAGLDVVGVVEHGGAGEAAGPLLGAVRALYHRLTGQRTTGQILEERDIPLYRTSDLHESRLGEWLESRECDVLIVYSVPILPKSLYGQVEWAVNLHPSLLPKYRGKHPLYWALWNDEDETGCTVHVLEERPDTGPIVAQDSFHIPPGARERELTRHAEVVVGVPLLVRAVRSLWAETADFSEQPEASPTRYASRLAPDAALETIPYAEWPLDRVWRVLRFLDTTPLSQAPESRAIWSWHVGGRDRRPGRGDPGSVQKDWRGYYISHGEGRIRLYPKVHPKNLARRGLGAFDRWVRDRGSESSGTERVGGS